MIHYVIHKGEGAIDHAGACEESIASAFLEIAPDALFLSSALPGYPQEWSIDLDVAAAYFGTTTPAPISEVLKPTGQTVDELLFVKVAAIDKIDAQTGGVRARYITVGHAQEAVYQFKLEEAHEVMLDPAITPGLVPHLANEAELNGTTIFGEAQTVIEKAYGWQYISAIIEPKRLAAKQAIRAATTREEIAAALEIDWSDLPPPPSAV